MNMHMSHGGVAGQLFLHIFGCRSRDLSASAGFPQLYTKTHPEFSGRAYLVFHRKSCSWIHPVLS